MSSRPRPSAHTRLTRTWQPRTHVSHPMVCWSGSGARGHDRDARQPPRNHGLAQNHQMVPTARVRSYTQTLALGVLLCRVRGCVQVLGHAAGAGAGSAQLHGDQRQLELLVPVRTQRRPSSPCNLSVDCIFHKSLEPLVPVCSGRGASQSQVETSVRHRPFVWHALGHF